MRRLDLHPLKKLRNSGRHLRSLRKWRDSFADFRWDERFGDQRFLHWRIPIASKLVDDKHTTPAIRAEVIQCLVDAMANLRASLPPQCRHMPVGALIEYPTLFNSEVTLFVDPDYFEGFKPEKVDAKTTRTEYGQIDVEPSHIDLVTEFGIRLPRDARAGGYCMRVDDFEWDGYVRETEHWVVAFWTDSEMPPAPSPAATQD